ncbi:MAG: trehalose-phosphatase [Pseudomonadota bacterium]
MPRSIGLDGPPPLSRLIEGGPLSLFLDFDGTLVDIAPRPDAIRVREGMDHLLTLLSSRLEGRCALVSGRPVDELQHYIGKIPVGWAGSHGADIRAAGGVALGVEPAGLPDEIERELKNFAEMHDLSFEQKPHGGALHYRSNPDKGEAVHAFAEALAAQHGWRAQSGKCVVELVAHEASKGEAVYAFMREAPFAGSRPYFIGDDLTDEAGFEACALLGGAGILVGDRVHNDCETKAQFALPHVASVHEWLEL